MLHGAVAAGRLQQGERPPGQQRDGVQRHHPRPLPDFAAAEPRNGRGGRSGGRSPRRRDIQGGGRHPGLARTGIRLRRPRGQDHALGPEKRVRRTGPVLGLPDRQQHPHGRRVRGAARPERPACHDAGGPADPHDRTGQRRDRPEDLPDGRRGLPGRRSRRALGSPRRTQQRQSVGQHRTEGDAATCGRQDRRPHQQGLRRALRQQPLGYTSRLLPAQPALLHLAHRGRGRRGLPAEHAAELVELLPVERRPDRRHGLCLRPRMGKCQLPGTGGPPGREHPDGLHQSRGPDRDGVPEQLLPDSGQPHETPRTE